MENLLTAIGDVLGLGEEDLNTWQMTLRVIVVYGAALLMVRLGKKRFLGENTAFDFILGIILGSVISRSITGNSPFIPTLAAALLMVVLHWVFSALAFHSDRFGTLIKGEHRTLVKDGEIQWDAMRKSNVSETDLMVALRTQARLQDIRQVKEARLERSGDISVIKVDSPPKIIEVKVEEGVQTVRIQLE
jgi:uncharacterized membrane protein YcaP (DUF421 family)